MRLEQLIKAVRSAACMGVGGAGARLLPGVVVGVAGSTAWAQEIVPVSQERSLGSFVIVPPCPPGTAFDNDEAVGFGPFEGHVQSALACELAAGRAAAGQRSVIGTRRIAGAGDADSQASAAVRETIHAIANSYFDVVFRIEARTRFRIRGALGAAGEAPTLVGAGIRLGAPGSAALLEQSVVPGDDGAPAAVHFNEFGEIEPGEYRLVAQSNSVIDQSIPPASEGRSSFEFSLVIDACPADWNADGEVNSLDFFDFLHDFFRDPPTADFNDDGHTSSQDFFDFLASFFAGCP